MIQNFISLHFPPPSLFHCFALTKSDSCPYPPHRTHMAPHYRDQCKELIAAWCGTHSIHWSHCVGKVCGFFTSEKVVAVVTAVPPRVKSHDPPPFQTGYAVLYIYSPGRDLLTEVSVSHCFSNYKHQHTHTHTHTHIYIYIYYLRSLKFNIIKTLKTLLHVSIIQSSSRSIHCSLLKL